MSITSVVDRVQKLLALSKSENANEAATAAALANKLIDQYRLSEIDLEIKGQAEEPIEEDAGYIYESGKVTTWKYTLVGLLVQHYGLSWWNDTSYLTGRMVSRYKLVGRRSDITVAKYMFNWLVLECQRLSNQHAKGQGRVYVASYCEGFVSGIADQLRASRVEVQKDATSAAIIRLDARSEASSDFLDNLHPELVVKKKKSFSRYNAMGYSAGLTSGRNIHLGESLGDGKAPKFLT